MTRALFIPFGPLGRVGEMVQRRKWTPTEFQIVASSHDAPGVTPNTVSGAKLSGKPGRGEGVTYPALATARLPTEFQIGPSFHEKQTVAAASRVSLRESVNAGEGVHSMFSGPAKASNATHPVSGSLRVGGEQANNNAAPHNFNTQRN